MTSPITKAPETRHRQPKWLSDIRKRARDLYVHNEGYLIDDVRALLEQVDLAEAMRDSMAGHWESAKTALVESSKDRVALQSSYDSLARELEQLREAATFASDVCAQIYAKYGLKIGPYSSQAQKANVMLRAALKVKPSNEVGT